MASDGMAAIFKHTHRDLVQECLEEEAIRSSLFGSALFSPSPFEIILTLYAAKLDRRQILISRIGEASGISQTTSLRWVEELQKSGLVVRIPHPSRGKHFFVVLTDKASAAMQCYLERRSL